VRFSRFVRELAYVGQVPADCPACYRQESFGNLYQINPREDCSWERQASLGRHPLALNLSSLFPEDPLAGTVANGDDRRIPDLPLDRNRVEVRPYLFGPADEFKAVSTLHDAVKDGGRGEHAQSSFGERPQQRKVIELSRHCRPNVLSLEPLV